MRHDTLGLRAAVVAVSAGGLAAWLPGCASDMSEIDASHRAWLEEGRSIAGGLAPLPTHAEQGSTELDGAVLHGPEDFVRVALARSPVIRAAEARVHRLEQLAPQARSLDDPMLMVSPVGEMAETAAGRVRTMTTLSQKLPLGSKLDARGRVAEQAAAEARADLEQARVKLAAQVRRAYWSHALAAWTIDTTRESRVLLVQLRDVADAQYRSGQRGQKDVLRASEELGSLDTQLSRLAQKQASSAAMLRRLLAAPAGFAIPVPEAPASIGADPGRDEAVALAERSSPALHALDERMKQFEARQRLAELNRWPDLTLSVSYNFVDDGGLAPMANGDDQWWIGLGFNLPVWRDRLDAAEREAMFGRIEAANAMSAERDRVVFDVEDTLARLGSQREVLALLRGRVIPDARAAVEASANDYQTGSGDFLVLIDNWRKLLAQQVLEQEVAAGIEMARADLSEAVGEESPPQAAAAGGADSGQTEPGTNPEGGAQ